MTIPNDVLSAKHAMSARLLRPRVFATASAACERSVASAVERTSLNIHAVGVGRKRVHGRDTAVPSVRVYVSRKLPRTQVHPDQRLPSQIDGIPIDVIESAPASLMSTPVCSANRQSHLRPVVGGISAAHPEVTAGTIACVCHSAAEGDDPETPFLLSNHHVFAAESGKVGDVILQPSRLDGGIAADQIAELYRVVPISPGGNVANRVDAAIGRIIPGTPFSPAVCMLGEITGTAAAVEDMRVRKHGRTTGYTEGVVTDESYDALVGMHPQHPAMTALFHAQMRIDRVDPFAAFALGGDSGSLVVHQQTADAVGLYFAGPASGAYGLANHIVDVMDELRIRLP